MTVQEIDLWFTVGKHLVSANKLLLITGVGVIEKKKSNICLR